MSRSFSSQESSNSRIIWARHGELAVQFQRSDATTRRNAVLLVCPSRDGLEAAEGRVRDHLAWETT